MTEPRPRARLERWLPVGLALLAVALYGQTVGFGLVNLDDSWLIGSNRLLSAPSVDGLGRILFDLSAETRLRLGGEYLPVRDLSVMLDYALFGRWFGGFHLTSVVLYGAVCALLLLVVRAWSGRAELALAATLLYLSHPIHVESVAWLSERKGLLAAALSLGCLLAFGRFARRGGRWRLTLSAALLLLACWSKALAVATVGLAAGLLWLWGDGLWEAQDVDDARGRRRAAWGGWLALVAVAALAFVPIWIAGQRVAMVAPHHGGGAGATAWLMGEVHALYLKHAALVGPLGIRYPVQDAAGARPLVALAGAAALVGIVAVALWAARRRVEPWRTAGVAAWAWLAFLAPVSQVLLPLQNVIADRYLLLPSVGWCLALAAGLLALRPRWLRWSAVAGLVAVQALLTVLQTRSWSNDRALYRQAVEVHPGNVTALVQLGRLAREAGRLAVAERWLARAAAVRPDDEAVLVQRATLRLARRDRPGAIALLRRAARAPRADKARANLALLLMRERRLPEALRWARSAVRIRPLKHHNQHTLGTVALNAGRLDEAARALERARRLRPDHAGTLYNLAVLAFNRGDRDGAAALLARVLTLAPDHRAARRLRDRVKGAR